MPKGSDGGGAVLNLGVLNVVGCSFDHNTAFSGAAILNYAVLNLTDSVLHSNLALAWGGAIFSYPGAKLVIKSCSIVNNRALGGIAALAVHGNSTIMNTDISNNVGMKYGAVFTGAEADGSATLRLANCTVSDNNSTDLAVVVC